MADFSEVRVHTFVRIRPHIKQPSLTERKKNILKFNKREVLVSGVQNRDPQTYEFDGVFGPDATQGEVFSTVAKPVINDVLSGYKCTVLAYGQTGSGKTYTMFGAKPQESISSWHKESSAGLIVRTIDSLFNELSEMDRKYHVNISYLELCNEQFFDLIALNDDGNNIKLYEDSNKGTVRLTGVTPAQVTSKEEVFRILERGALHRKSVGTHVEGELSRSHSILMIKVCIKESAAEEIGISEGLVRIGYLNLVDLADSNPISKACGVDKYMRQATTSNQSLLQLGRVITALAEGAPHVPYRASKLTRILQDSLGGQTKTSIISTVSPSASNLEDTLNTLKYSASARNIVNRPIVNKHTNIKYLFKVLCEDIQKLTWDLEATLEKSGVFVTDESYREICEKTDEQNREYKEKLKIISSLKTQIKEKEVQLMELKNLFQKECACLESVQLSVRNTEYWLRKLRYRLGKTDEKHKEQQLLVNTMKSNEDQLSEQVKLLKSVCTEASNDADSLQDKVERIRYIKEENTEGVFTFKERMLKMFRDIEGSIQYNLAVKLTCLKNQKNVIVNNYNIRHSVLEGMQNQILKTREAYKKKMADQEEQIQNLINTTHECGDLRSAELIESGKKVVQNVHSHVQPVLEEMLHSVVRGSELLTVETKREINEIDRQVDSLISKNSQFLQSLIVLKNSVLSLNDELINALHKCIEEAEMIVSAAKTKRNHMKAQFVKLLEETTKIQQLSDNKFVIGAMKDQETSFINTVNLCSKVKSGLDKSVKKIATIQDAMNSDLTDCQNNINETVTEFLKKFQGIISSSAEETKVTRSELNTSYESCNNRCKHFKDSAMEDTTKFSSAMEGHMSSIKQTVETVSNQIVPEHHEQYLDTLKERKDTLISDFDHKENYVQQWQHQMATDVKKLNATINELTNLKTCVPTGNTPERKDYRFPTDIIQNLVPRTIIESDTSNNNDLMEEKE